MQGRGGWGADVSAAFLSSYGSISVQSQGLFHVEKNHSLMWDTVTAISESDRRNILILKTQFWDWMECVLVAVPLNRVTCMGPWINEIRVECIIYKFNVVCCLRLACSWWYRHNLRSSVRLIVILWLPSHFIVSVWWKCLHDKRSHILSVTWRSCCGSRSRRSWQGENNQIVGRWHYKTNSTFLE